MADEHTTASAGALVEGGARQSTTRPRHRLPAAPTRPDAALASTSPALVLGTGGPSADQWSGITNRGRGRPLPEARSAGRVGSLTAAHPVRAIPWRARNGRPSTTYRVRGAAAWSWLLADRTSNKPSCSTTTPPGPLGRAGTDEGRRRGEPRARRWCSPQPEDCRRGVAEPKE